MSQLRVALFVDIFPPSMGGGATRALRIVQGMAALGWHVTVITTSCTYPVGRSVMVLKYIEEKGVNFRIIRVPSINLPFKGLLNRVLNYSISGFSLTLIASKLKKMDLIFSIGMHPFTDLAANLAKVNSPNSRLVTDISDLLPEDGILNAGSIILNNTLLRLSDCITLHNERMKNIFKLKYNFYKPVIVLHNSVDIEFFNPFRNPQKRKNVMSTLCGRDLSNCFVMCYFGVLGPFQGLTKVVIAAEKLQNELNDIVFLIIGDGEEKLEVSRLASTAKNVILLPKMNREIIADIAAEADIGLVPLVSTDPLVVYVNLPSKAAEFLSSGVPILAGKGTFIGNLVSKCNAGYEVDFNDIDSICSAVRYLHLNKEELTQKALNARNLAVTAFSLEAEQTALSVLDV